MSPLVPNSPGSPLFPPFSLERFSESDSSKSLQKFEDFIPHVDLPSSSLQKKMKREEFHDLEVLEKNIAQSFSDVNRINENIQSIEQGVAKIDDINGFTGVFQAFLIDFILKGGSFYFEYGMPYMLEGIRATSSPDQLVEVEDPILRWVKIVTEVVDLGTGYIGLFRKKQILSSIRKKISEMDHADLKPEQILRLKQVKKLIKQEESVLSARINSQTIRRIRSCLSLAILNLHRVTHPLVSLISLGLTSVCAGLATILEIKNFYSTNKNLKIHRRWVEQFKKSLKTKEVRELFKGLKGTRDERYKNQLKIVQKKGLKNRKKLEHISEKVEKIKTSGLQRFLEKLDFTQINENQLKDLLQEKLGSGVVSLETSREIRNAYLSGKQASIEKSVRNCVKNWVKKWPKETLLSTYMDYQAVLDTTIKGSLAQMVTNKHQMDATFLTAKRNMSAVSLTTSIAVTSVITALLIIGLATAPLGGTGLILILLTAASITIALGLMGAKYYYANREHRELTHAILKGAYLKLFCYYALMKIHSLKEQVGHYLSRVSQRSLFKHVLTQPNEELLKIDAAQSKSEYWNQRAIALEKELQEKLLKDFARKADIKIANESHDFDTLEVLQEALAECDLTLLRPDTIVFLEKQFGLDIHAIQKEMQKDPEAIKNLLKKFFTMSDSGFLQFIQFKEGENSF